MNTLSDLFAHLDQDPAKDPFDQLQTMTPMRCDGALGTAEEALRYVLGGNATVTLRSAKTGTRFTYRIRLSEDGKLYFVSLLTGSDNENSYQYVGHIFADQRIFWHGRKSKISQDAPGAKAWKWSYAKILRGELPDQLEIWHEGSCGRCGRKLTVPESVRSGFGPECATKV